MKKIFGLLLALILFIGLFGAAPTTVTAQSGPDDGFSRAREIAVEAVAGDCSQLPTPSFDNLGKRDLTLNEDSTRIVAYYDNFRKTVCVVVWGAWPGTVGNDGLSEFDSMARVYKNGNLINTQDKPLIRSNPNISGVPFHTYEWKVPCGVGEYYVLLDFFQQQIKGLDRLGMPHRDWSGVYRAEECKLFLPIIWRPTPPPPTLTCAGWTIDIKDNDGPVVTGFDFEVEPGWAETLKTLLLYPGEIGNARIKYNGEWTGTDLSGMLKDVEVIFQRQDGSASHNISSRFDNLDGSLYASDMDNDTINWWWLTIRLRISSGNQSIWCQQRIAGIDPVIANRARELIKNNPGMSWESALAAALGGVK